MKKENKKNKKTKEKRTPVGRVGHSSHVFDWDVGGAPYSENLCE